jgi:hypothetical protein
VKLRGCYGRGVPVEDCIATTGAMTGKGCDGMGLEGRRDGVLGAVKEGEGSNVTVDGKNFGEEVGGVDKAGEEDKTNELLAVPLLASVKTHVNRLGLLWPNRRSRKTDRAFVVDE